MRFASSPDSDTFKSEAARKLAPAIGKLAALELVSHPRVLTVMTERTDASLTPKIDDRDSWVRMAFVRAVPRDHDAAIEGGR